MKKSFGEKCFDSVNILFLLFMVLITLYPFVHIVAASLSVPDLLVGHQGLLLIPKGFSLISYDFVLKNPNILSGYITTIFVVITGTALNILLTALGAYVLSRKRFFGKTAMMVMIVFTMYFQGGLVPRYLLIYSTLNLGNNLLALILPHAIIVYNLIIMRTAFMAIPDSMEESAKLDGANDFIVLFKIILPLALPTVSVLMLFYGVNHWNSWFDALIFLRERKLYPLQLILREILISNSTGSMMSGTQDKELLGESIKYATIMVATLPILFIYPYMQKFFVKGVMVGAVKG